MQRTNPAANDGTFDGRLEAMVRGLRCRFGAEALPLARRQRDDAAGGAARTWAEIASRLAS